MLVHQHSIIDAIVSRRPDEIACADLERFLGELVDTLGMKRLFEPIAINGKYGFTGIVGIVTSHVAFHYFDHDRSLHFDVYSCKEYSLREVVKFIDEFWRIESASVVVIDREVNIVDRYTYRQQTLRKEEAGNACAD